jgi:hypothetical protein
MDLHRLLKRLRLSFVRADFGPATISSTSKRGVFKRCGCDKRFSHHLCSQHSLVALGAISNNFLYARSANIRNKFSSRRSRLNSGGKTNWFSRERHSILLFYRREIGAELPATHKYSLPKCAALVSSNFFGGVCSQTQSVRCCGTSC